MINTTNFAGIMATANSAVINNKILNNSISYEFSIIAMRKDSATVRALMLDANGHLITDMKADDLGYWDIKKLAEYVEVKGLEEYINYLQEQ